ncbi:hypothetical protein PCANC_12457 [Puccinia coronata f. sp. avenae]|uniref:1-alkyl-2-acetylglycerophosphocholine esterase n=1 Tax=Puccinia coronata f. sp. avenae TaxID=200324 RepID=A0A2N5T045_9BASI|nr:hypothetical protein PCANC_12457 [Puccinia coronata f. sp. avenae]
MDAMAMQPAAEPSTTTHPPSVLPPIDADTDMGAAPLPSFSRRGPWRWTDYLGCYLPSYDGPHDVGTLTLELPLPEPYASYELSSPMKRHDGRPVLELHPTLMTIFYPVRKEPVASSMMWGRVLSLGGRLVRRDEGRLRWITLAQIQGYLRFAGITSSWKRWLVIPPLLLAMGSTKLPTRGGAPICTKTKKKDEGEEGERYKLVIFSHGLTGNRTCYSQLCGRLASQGYVVAAVEHRDGTSSHSVVTEHRGGRPVGKPVEYVDMADVSAATRPENYLIARAFQLELRTLEILAAAKSLAALAHPTPTSTNPIKLANLRTRGAPGWAADDGARWSDQQWAQFAAAVDWDHDVTLAGHSFGAADVVTAARHPDRPKAWRRFILYDPWLETLEHCSAKFLGSLTPSEGCAIADDFPCLVVNSPGFTVWEEHFKKLQQLFIVDRPRTHQLCLFATLGGIIHSSFSDLPVLVEWLWKITKKLKLDSQKAVNMVTDLTIAFIEHDVDGATRTNNDDDGNDGDHEKQEKMMTSQVHAATSSSKISLASFIDRHQQDHVDAPPDHHHSWLDALKPGKLLVHFKRLV